MENDIDNHAWLKKKRQEDLRKRGKKERFALNWGRKASAVRRKSSCQTERGGTEEEH